MRPAPGLLSRTAYRFVWHRQEPFRISIQLRRRNAAIPGRLQLVHTPGPGAGQVAMLRQGARLPIAGDVTINIVGLSHSAECDTIEEDDAAMFGHGRTIRRTRRRARARGVGTTMTHGTPKP